MDPGHKARKNPSDNAGLGFQAVGLALRFVQLNGEGLSAAFLRIQEEEVVVMANIISMMTMKGETDRPWYGGGGSCGCFCSCGLIFGGGSGGNCPTNKHELLRFTSLLYRKLS